MLIPSLTPLEWALALASAALVGFSKTGVPGTGILVVPLMRRVFGDESLWAPAADAHLCGLLRGGLVPAPCPMGQALGAHPLGGWPGWPGRRYAADAGTCGRIARPSERPDRRAGAGDAGAQSGTGTMGGRDWYRTRVRGQPSPESRPDSPPRCPMPRGR